MKTKITLDTNVLTPEAISSIVHLCTPGSSGIAMNQNGEKVMIEICSDHIELTTFQHNHWIRVNEYYDDGTSCESFEGKWED